MPPELVRLDTRRVVLDDGIAHVVLVLDDAVEYDPSNPVRVGCGEFTRDPRTGMGPIQIHTIERKPVDIEICVPGWPREVPEVQLSLAQRDKLAFNVVHRGLRSGTSS